jgi:hypothetical protein
VDDDKEPAPKKIPTEDESSIQVSSLKEGQNWGWDGIVHRTTVKLKTEDIQEQLLTSW